MSLKEEKAFELTTGIGRLKDLSEEDIRPYDGVYLGDPFCEFGSSNILEDEKALREAVKVLKALGKKAYLSTYVEPWSDTMPRIEKIVDAGLKAGIDGVSVSDLGVLRLMSKKFKAVDIHISNFVNFFNSQSAKFLSGFNVKRIMPYPELSLSEIEEIRKNSGLQVELEVHGKIPLGLAELCIITPEHTRLKKRCNGPCYDGFSLKKGNYAMKSCGRVAFGNKDLCMFDYMGLLIDKGYRFFRIESMFETGEYRRKAGKIYRERILSLLEGKNEPNPFNEDMICNGYYFEKPGIQYVRCG